MPDPRTCGKCGSDRTRVIGQSVSPPAAFVQCQECGHSSLVAVPKPATNNVDKRHIEHLVNTVITDFGLPCQLLAVVDAPEGWHVAVKTVATGVVRFTVKAEALSAMRATVRRALEYEPT